MERLRSAAAVAAMGGVALAVAVLLASCSPPATPSSPSGSGGKVISIAAGKDLASAAGKAPAGATLALDAGHYVLTATLLVDKDLALDGAGVDKTFVEFDGGARGDPVVDVEGAAFTVTGVSFVHTGTAAGGAGVASDATLDLRHCAFSGAVGATAGDGLVLAGSTTGTIRHCRFSHNARAGLRSTDAAAVTVRASDIYGNGADGAAFQAQSAGTLYGGSVHDNTGAGIHVLDGAHPTLSANQVASNHPDGILVEGSGAGNVTGNVVTGNGNGLRFAGHSQPGATDNTSQHNSLCGLDLDDTTEPTLVDNAVTANGTNLCDRRTLSLPPVAHTCAAAPQSLNPDPASDLVVVVEDANGNPVQNAVVSLALLDAKGGMAYFNETGTDAQGVAVLLDTAVQTWVATGGYSAFVGTYLAGTVEPVLTACGGVQFPGSTVLVTPADPSLMGTTLNLTVDGATPTRTTIEAGYAWGDQYAMDAGDTLHQGTLTAMLPGSYRLGLLAETATDAYLTYLDLSVNGPATIDHNVASAPTAEVDFAVHDAQGGSGVYTDHYLYRQDPALLSPATEEVRADTVHLTPGDYQANAALGLADPANAATWRYTFRIGTAHYGPAGSRTTVSVGGALHATISASATYYLPGDRVYLAPHVLDGAGDDLVRVDIGPAVTSVQSRLVSPILHAAPAPSSTTQGSTTQALTDNQVTVTVTDPNGALVATLLDSVSLPGHQLAFTLSGSALPGTYTVSLSIGLGPYQSAPLTASTTFTVQ